MHKYYTKIQKVYLFAENRERLRKMREEQKRCSEEVIEIWEDLRDFSYKLGDECEFWFTLLFASPEFINDMKYVCSVANL